ncbi:Asparaginase/glutaminase [Pelagophyceae sp. CCMP2097]|nr:Asparaginase/glutaminase [Pelagophyceae sp. CCMP2097]
MALTLTHVRVLTMGGSVDKTYSGVESAFIVGAPAARSILKDLSKGLRFKFAEICRKDSLELTDADVEAAMVAVRSADEKLILITHGTDTMARTAMALDAVAKDLGKTVVLTGSMRPAAFKESDAAFNVGMALGVLGLLPAGAHLVMNGRVFSDVAGVRKDASRDAFFHVDDHYQNRPAAADSRQDRPEKGNNVDATAETHPDAAQRRREPRSRAKPRRAADEDAPAAANRRRGSKGSNDSAPAEDADAADAAASPADAAKPRSVKSRGGRGRGRGRNREGGGDKRGYAQPEGAGPEGAGPEGNGAAEPVVAEPVVSSA